METSGKGVDSLKLFLKDNPSYDIYDYSQLELADQCLRKYSFRYIHSMKFPDSVEAAFSSHIIHPLVARIFSNKPIEDPKEWLKFVKAYTSAITGIPLTYKQRNAYNIDVAKTIYQNVTHRHTEQFLDIDHTKTTSEIVYWRVLPNLKNAVWLSKPDVIIERPQDNWKATIEVKCSTFAPNASLNPFDRQILSQAWTTQFPLQIRIFNMIQLTSENKLSHIDCFTENNMPDYGLMSEWLEEIEFAVAVIQKAKSSGIFPKRSPKACMDFGKPCPMMEFCTIGPGRQLLMDTRPKENPFAYLGL